MTDPQVPAQPDPGTQPTQPVPPLGQQPYTYPTPPQPQPQPVQVPGAPAGGAASPGDTVSFAQQPYGATATLAPPQPYAASETPPPSANGSRGRAVWVGVGAVLAGLVLLLAGFGLGRATAPSSGGPASLVDAVRMAQQGTLPCGTAGPNDRVGAFVIRLCRLSPGQNGPGNAPFGPFGGNGGGNRGNGNGNGNDPGNGSANGSANGSGNGGGA
jgi:hypothetical protein